MQHLETLCGQIGPRPVGSGGDRRAAEYIRSVFSFRGVPAVALSSVGGPNLAHLPSDTPEWISPARLTEVVSLASGLAERLQDKPLGWCRGRPA
jgi:hypothetical protein